MGVSKIVREIEGIVGDRWGYERGVWVMGMVWVVWKVRGFGVFLENKWEWVSLGCEVWWEWVKGEWGESDDWFVGNI